MTLNSERQRAGSCTFHWEDLGYAVVVSKCGPVFPLGRALERESGFNLDALRGGGTYVPPGKYCAAQMTITHPVHRNLLALEIEEGVWYTANLRELIKKGEIDVKRYQKAA
jgi:hypothetical protein